MKNSKKLLALLFTICIFYSCKKDKNIIPDPQSTDENEVITTIKLTFKEMSDSTKTITATFKDPDGTGGINYTIFDTIKLKKNNMYDLEILLLDETKTPAHIISDEVKEKGDQHQFFFTPSSGVPISIDYSDRDVNKVPIGLLSHISTNGATTNNQGKLKIQLKHQGTDKPKTGQGDPTIGSTDVEVDFPIIIK